MKVKTSHPWMGIEKPSIDVAAQCIATVLRAEKLPCNEVEPALFRIEVPVDSCDLLGLLASAHCSEKFYWSNREKAFEWMGLGTAIKIEGQAEECELAAQLVESFGEEIQLFGGMRFDADAPVKDTSWKKFSQTCFILPTLELKKDLSGTKVAVNILLNATHKVESALKLLEQTLMYANPVEQKIGLSISDIRVSSLEEWTHKVELCLARCEDRILDKVVLANAHDFVFDEPIDPVVLLMRLNDKSSLSYRFLMQLSKEDAFVGASPERLYSREGLRIESEAQAGTRRRGKNDNEDAELSKVLLGSEKDFREHDLVIQDIESKLSNLCIDSGWIDQRKIIKLSHVQHLRSRFGGILKEGVSDFDILQALHPTPAICGRPKEAALACIRELEEFDRGYYCGPIGMLGSKKSEFAVALRSALVSQNRIRLYAGAGLVKGSTAEDEWNEIESKMRLYYEVLAE